MKIKVDAELVIYIMRASLNDKVAKALKVKQKKVVDIDFKIIKMRSPLRVNRSDVL